MRKENDKLQPEKWSYSSIDNKTMNETEIAPCSSFYGNILAIWPQGQYVGAVVRWHEHRMSCFECHATIYQQQHYTFIQYDHFLYGITTQIKSNYISYW